METTNQPQDFLFTSDKIALSPYKAADAKQLFNLVNKNKHRLQESFPTLIAAATEEKIHELLSTREKEFTERKNFSFAIKEIQSGALIGHFVIINIDWSVPKAELSYWIDEDYEGKGVMSSAFGLLLNFAFNVAQIRKLFLRVIPSNTRSAFVAEKFGFAQEGYLKEDFKTGTGIVSDLVYYGLTQKEYRKNHNY